MDQKKTTRFLVCFTVLIVLVVVLLARNSLRSSAHIVLPAPQSAVEDESGASGADGGAVVKVEVTPETVQYAVETLRRPDRYRRTVTVETIWSGGSATAETRVVVCDGYTRTDADLPSGQTRHSITNGEHTWVWYGNSAAWAVFSAGDISADDEQRIPTYEDILRLPREAIAAAEYTTFSDLACIYVETAPDDAGYTQRYWVSASMGLLIGAERLADGEAVYRMISLEASSEAPNTLDFTLPDGTVLLSVVA